MESSLRIQEVDGLELVRKFSEDMETMLRRKVEAVKVLQVLCSMGGERGILPQPLSHSLMSWPSILSPTSSFSYLMTVCLVSS